MAAFLGDLVDVADMGQDTTLGVELGIARQQQRGDQFAHQIPPTSLRCSKRTVSQERVTHPLASRR
jgi:hypothetical protein